MNKAKGKPFIGSDHVFCRVNKYKTLMVVLNEKASFNSSVNAHYASFLILKLSSFPRKSRASVRERFSAVSSGREILLSCVFRHGQCYPDFPNNLITVTRAYAVELYGSFTFSRERATRAAVEQGTSITSGV